MDDLELIPVVEGVDLGEEWCRRVEDGFTPFIRQEFSDIESGIIFYNIYARASGFDVRRSTTKKHRDGTIKKKLLLCNREGFKKQSTAVVSSTEDSEKKQFKITRVGCTARLRLSLKNGVYVVDVFHEAHNHELVLIKHREFQKLSRQVSSYHKEMILNNSRLKVGATKTFRMCKEQVNVYENVGANLIDFKKISRDIKCFIGQRDSQLFIDRFKNIAENLPGFYFDYDVDKDGRLCRVIWVDETMKRNYRVFSDAVAYDPTYRTNKYYQLFTPFTGIDNHKRSVTFCGALISHEDYDSFNWVFSRFLIAMDDIEPDYVITYQDPAIIKSVGHIFKTARHRFFMWHIMNKIPTKYGATRKDYPDFIKKLNGIVWDEDLEPADFDAKWDEIMKKHGVGEEDWFAEVFDIRGKWIMAHCKDLKMGGIMNTTQRSESENRFFKRFEDKHGTLVEFWMHFESAMNQQRHTQKKLDNDCRYSMPKLISQLPIERHGAKVYTNAIFVNFQEEVKYSMTTCSVGGFSKNGLLELTTLYDAFRDRSFDVEFNSAKCNCRLYELKGIICRHLIWMYSGKRQERIPDIYIKERWTKNATCMEVFNGIGDTCINNDDDEEKQRCLIELWSEIKETTTLLSRRDKETVKSISKLIRDFRTKYGITSEKLNKKQEIEHMLKFSTIEEVKILPPKQSKNKGSGRRMVSNKAKATAVAAKPKQRCKNCKRMAHHDKRNCPNPYSEDIPMTEEDSEELEEDEEIFGAEEDD